MKKNRLLLTLLTSSFLIGCQLNDVVNEIKDEPKEETIPSMIIKSKLEEVEISKDGKEFVNIDKLEYFTNNQYFDITSTDGKNFYSPIISPDGVSVIGLNKITSSLNNYYEEDLYIRTTKNGMLKIDSSSFVLPLSYDNNMSPLGNFTANYIASSIRVSFEVVGYQDSKEKEYSSCYDYETSINNAIVVEPDNDLFKYDDDERKPAGIGGKVNQIYLEEDIKTGKYTLISKDHNQGVREIIDDNETYIGAEMNFNGWGNSEETENVLAIIGSTPYSFTKDNYQITHVKIRVWNEGQDTECVSAFAGGKFIVGLVIDFQ